MTKNFNVGPDAVTIIIHEFSEEHLAKTWQTDNRLVVSVIAQKVALLLRPVPV